MVKQEYECIVCGKKFNEGQGIVLTKGSLKLTFHSSKCVSKFFKLYLERLDESCSEKSARDLIKELEKIREEKQKQTKKVIS
ncbi:hypothetical protein Calag_0387 [Caldisphaera lagunensis DSM 15908]|uniref:Uncharacterized protein n=1 Tax=Caldisphaera lagunensis (strain DSM 15908 / JCM 11604 / ANMR 0165 / IC-154) TaxID=1056495 RepID=L0AAW1_CALLD|nr:hypothetical protein [Caldisphaera lagunensis]AFZ70160.1 hypothetical protein Calag_0387 [Caldisphaera lagunensis DSM 15908]